MKITRAGTVATKRMGADAFTGIVFQDPVVDAPAPARLRASRVTFTPGHAGTGWHAPQTVRWLTDAVEAASVKHYGKPSMSMGEGGTIPFMAMLGAKYPQAQFLITGVLGPHSNAHGPNEFLHIPMGKRVTASVSRVIAEHHLASQRGETRGAKPFDPRAAMLLQIQLNHEAIVPHHGCPGINDARRRHGGGLAGD